jgi:O-acetylserine/cysteine efflux transporter
MKSKTGPSARFFMSLHPVVNAADRTGTDRCCKIFDWSGQGLCPILRLEKEMPLPLRDTLLTLLVIFIWGTSFIAMRLGVEEMPPLMLTAGRFFFSAIPAIFLLPKPGASLQALAGYGLVLGVGMFGLVFSAIHLGMPISLTSVVAQMQVFFTMLIAFVLYGERPTRIQATGAVLAGLGMVLFAQERAASAPLGPFLMVICGAFCWGIANIIGKRARPANMASFVSWASLFAPLPLVALSYALDGPQAVAQSLHWPSLTLALSIAYMAFGANTFAFAAWGALLARHPVSTVAPFALLIPVIGIASGTLLFDEKLTPMLIIGSGVVVAGLALNVFGDRLAARLRR